MGVSEVLSLAAEWGPMGLLVAYLMWRDHREDKHEEKRIAADAARSEADLAIARAMTGLSYVIQGRVHVQD